MSWLKLEIGPTTRAFSQMCLVRQKVKTIDNKVIGSKILKLKLKLYFSFYENELFDENVFSFFLTRSSCIDLTAMSFDDFYASSCVCAWYALVSNVCCLCQVIKITSAAWRFDKNHQIASERKMVMSHLMSRMKAAHCTRKKMQSFGLFDEYDWSGEIE